MEFSHFTGKVNFGQYGIFRVPFTSLHFFRCLGGARSASYWHSYLCTFIIRSFLEATQLIWSLDREACRLTGQLLHNPNHTKWPRVHLHAHISSVSSVFGIVGFDFMQSSVNCKKNKSESDRHNSFSARSYCISHKSRLQPGKVKC